MDLKDVEIWENALISVIKKEIGPSAVILIKNRLLEKYGTTMQQSFQKWEIIEDVLRENFGGGYNTINSKLIAKIANSHSKYGQPIFNPKNNDNSVIKLIGDYEVGAMLNQVLNDSKIIKDIISNAKVPQTTAYRKIEKMKQLGLLVENGFALSPQNKQIIKYTSPFESFSIFHENGKSSIKYGPKKNLGIKLITK